MFNIKFSLIFIFCMFLALPVFGREDVLYSGSAEIVGLAALHDWTGFKSPIDLYEGMVFGTTLSTRFRLELRPPEGMRAVLEGTASYTGGYANPFSRYETTGLPPDTAFLEASSLPGADFNSFFEIDQAWVSWNMGIGEMSMGIIPVSWGSAWLLNPSDRVNQRSLERFFSDKTEGLPALTAELALGWNFGLSGYLMLTDSSRSGLPQMDEARPEYLPFGIKALAFLEGWEISAGLAGETSAVTTGQETLPSRERDIWAISDITGDIASFGLTMESAIRMTSSDRLNESERTLEEALEISTGISYLINPLNTEVLIEYIHLGSGADRPEEYDIAGFLKGTRLFFAEDYLFGHLSWTGLPGLTMEWNTLYNLNDGGILIIPSLEWEIAADILFSFGLYAAMGDGTSEFGGDRMLAPDLFWSPWDDTVMTCGMKVYF